MNGNEANLDFHILFLFVCSMFVCLFALHIIIQVNLSQPKAQACSNLKVFCVNLCIIFCGFSLLLSATHHRWSSWVCTSLVSSCWELFFQMTWKVRETSCTYCLLRMQFRTPPPLPPPPSPSEKQRTKQWTESKKNYFGNLIESHFLHTGI